VIAIRVTSPFLLAREFDRRVVVGDELGVVLAVHDRRDFGHAGHLGEIGLARIEVGDDRIVASLREARQMSFIRLRPKISAATRTTGTAVLRGHGPVAAKIAGSGWNRDVGGIEPDSVGRDLLSRGRL
jgi:hypothetical protein